MFSIWHLFWHSILPFYLAFHLALSGISSAIPSDMGTAGPQPPPDLSGSAHWDLELVVEVPLRFGVRVWGPAVPAEIRTCSWGPRLLGENKEEEEQEGSNSDKICRPSPGRWKMKWMKRMKWRQNEWNAWNVWHENEMTWHEAHEKHEANETKWNETKQHELK